MFAQPLRYGGIVTVEIGLGSKTERRRVPAARRVGAICARTRGRVVKEAREGGANCVVCFIHQQPHTATPCPTPPSPGASMQPFSPDDDPLNLFSPPARATPLTHRGASPLKRARLSPAPTSDEDVARAGSDEAVPTSDAEELEELFSRDKRRSKAYWAQVARREARWDESSAGSTQTRPAASRLPDRTSMVRSTWTHERVFIRPF